MKKLFGILLAVIMLFCALSAAVCAEPLPDNVEISYDASAPGNVKAAAEILKEYTARLYKGKTQPGSVCKITLTGLPAEKETPDGAYTVKGNSSEIEITGFGENGILYAVYDFLREYGGYHVYTADAGMRTDFTELKLPETINTEYTPAFEYTDTDWPAASDTEFSRANCVNGRLFRYYSDEPGGSAGYISNFCHTLTTQFCSSEKYFSEDPGLFALHAGRRTPDQLCLTNEKTYQIVLGEVMELLKEKHDPEASLQIISLTQHDNYHYCQCKNCAATDAENGSQAGTIVTFVNRIAKAVKEAGYDNVAIDTFAYQYSRKAPSKVVPEDNVIIRLCTIECCFSHALDDPSCSQNVLLKQDLEEWNAICDNIYIWDYTTNYGRPSGIFPDFAVLQSNIRFFRSHGVKGIFEEGAAHADDNHVEFGRLRAYLISRLLRDPDCDYEAEAKAFVNAHYGKGGEKIWEFICRMDENAAKRHVEIFMQMTESFSLTEEEAKELDGLWDEAKLLSADDETALGNIASSEISWRYVKSSLKLGEFAGIVSRANANTQLYEDIMAHNAALSPDGNEVALRHVFRYFPAEDWMNANRQAVVLYLPAILLYAAVLAECFVIFVLAVKKKKFSYLIHLPLLAAFVEAFMWSRRAFLAWKAIDEYCITLGIFLAVTGYVFIQKNRLICTSKAKTLGRSLLDLLVFVSLYAVPVLTIKKKLTGSGDTNSDFALITAFTLCAAFLLFAVIKTRRELKAAQPHVSKKAIQNNKQEM